MVLCVPKYVWPERGESISQIDVIERAAFFFFFFQMHGKNPSELITMRAFVSLVCGHVGKVHPSLVLGKMENMCMCVQVYFIYFLGSNNSGCKIIHIIRRRFTAIQYPIFYGLPFKKKKILTVLYF